MVLSLLTPRRTALFGAALALASLPVAAAADPLPASAFALEANLDVDNTGTQYGPIAYVSGTATEPYYNVESVAREDDKVGLVATFPTPTLFVTARDMVSRAQSSGIEVDSTSARSDSRLGSLSLYINLNPPPPSTAPGAGAPPIPQPLIQITGREIHSRTSGTEVVPGPIEATGAAEFESLEISGSLVGYARLHFSGTIKPNTVVYDTPDVTITLNKQVEYGTVTCVKTVCTLKLVGVTTEAVDVSIVKYKWYGHKVTGDLAIGGSHVQFP